MEFEITKAELKNKEDDIKEDKYRILAALSFIIVVVLVGVPMWWKTTEVYRVSLPTYDIEDLSNHPVNIGAKILVYTFDTTRAEILTQELKDFYENNETWKLNFLIVKEIENAAGFHTPAALERAILKKYPLNEGDFLIMEWPRLQDEILLTTDRSAYIKSDTSSVKISYLLNYAVLQTHRIKDIESKDQSRLIKSEAPQTHYDIIVSVLNHRPDIMNVQWNVQMAVETYLERFFNEVSQISNFTLKTQWKFQVPFEADLKQVRDSSKLGRHYALSETALPNIITSIEKNLGSGISDRPSLNMVVYVAPCEISPLHIYNEAGEKVTQNNVDSFISPRWGAVIIVNPKENICMQYLNSPKAINVQINSNDVMQIMLYQLQQLLDIHVELNIPGIKVVELEQIAPHTWALEAYLRRSAVIHLVTATHTLQSLIKLLNNISYIVINDEVGAAVNEAYEQIVLSKKALAEGRLLAASAAAKKAYVASEHAFFDASLLAQLYFPDEQKYAIYIPLFLPIMVPVLTSLFTLKKLLHKVREAEKPKFD